MESGLDLILPEATGFAVGSFFWIAVPVIIGLGVAGSRGLVAWPAALICLFGGWLGAILVILFYNSSTVIAPSQWSRMEERGSAPNDDPSIARLRTLNRLLDEGLIGPEEYEQKRREVLETI